MAASEALTDYYAVLQVHPDADREVIEAAYRQLMKKHHPDVAGTDPERVAQHHARSKAINQAFSVLRDPAQRRAYDEQRLVGGTRRPPPRSSNVPGGPRESPPPPAPPPPPPRPAPAVGYDGSVEVVVEVDPKASALWGPFSLVAAAYYLLPGAYEWEPGHQWELLSVFSLPVVGIAGFCLATGRLSPWIGTSLNAKLLVGALLVLLAVPMLQQLPRVIGAAGPTLLLATGLINAPLQQIHLPVWLAWCAMGGLSMLFAARLYIFAVLPTIGVCLVIARSG